MLGGCLASFVVPGTKHLEMLPFLVLLYVYELVLCFWEFFSS